jgi:hypothetical protein
MTRRKPILVYSLFAVLVGGQLVAIITAQELWPFSPYPMYAESPQTQAYRVIRLVGVTVPRSGKPSREVSLDAAWVRNDLARLSRRVQPHKELTRAMGSYLRKYGWRRPGDPKSKPQTLRALRVYEQHWDVSEAAENAKKPDRVRLLAEVYRTADGGIAIAATQPDKHRP